MSRIVTPKPKQTPKTETIGRRQIRTERRGAEDLTIIGNAQRLHKFRAERIEQSRKRFMQSDSTRGQAGELLYRQSNYISNQSYSIREQ